MLVVNRRIIHRNDQQRFQLVKHRLFLAKLFICCCVFSSVVTPASRSHPQRASSDLHLKRVNSQPTLKPPREVFLRVKFIRLGEVSSTTITTTA